MHRQRSSHTCLLVNDVHALKILIKLHVILREVSASTWEQNVMSLPFELQITKKI